MRTLTEEDIRTRAYKLWKAAGESTKCDAFWYQAEKETIGRKSEREFWATRVECHASNHSTTTRYGPDGRSLARMRVRIIRAIRRAATRPDASSIQPRLNIAARPYP